MTSFLTLAEAAKLVPGADENTLKRLARAGKLIVYRPGKKHLTTAEHLMEAITQKCRVAPKARISGCIPPDTTPPASLPMSQLGLSSMEIAEAALDLALAQQSKKKTKR